MFEEWHSGICSRKEVKIGEKLQSLAQTNLTQKWQGSHCY
jgi:hypothetical protein